MSGAGEQEITVTGAGFSQDGFLLPCPGANADPAQLAEDSYDLTNLTPYTAGDWEHTVIYDVPAGGLLIVAGSADQTEVVTSVITVAGGGDTPARWQRRGLPAARFRAVRRRSRLHHGWPQAAASVSARFRAVGAVWRPEPQHASGCSVCSGHSVCLAFAAWELGGTGRKEAAVAEAPDAFEFVEVRRPPPVHRPQRTTLWRMSNPVLPGGISAELARARFPEDGDARPGWRSRRLNSTSL